MAKKKKTIRDEINAEVKARFVRVAPRKARLVADMIRGKMVNDAFSILEFSPQKSAEIIKKLIKSGVANIMNNAETKKIDIDPDKLYIKETFVNEGPDMKRLNPRAFGRADIVRKRSSHITVVLGEK
ncbi:MAG: 50S ribosomal protein L22 [Candidatus Schekmanbacteria bacterium]|nr:MAG: 50S ribosomal protein L22 [Candidatus Schekmanbacteria bacterium]